METELRGEVGHERLILLLLGQMLREPGAFAIQVGFEFFVNLLHPVPVGFVLGRRFQAGLLHQPEHFDGAMVTFFPQDRIEFFE